MRTSLNFLIALTVFVVACSEDSILDPAIPQIADPQQSLVGKSDAGNLSARATKNSVEVIDAVNGGVVGTSVLHRNKNGITANFSASGLEPGHAYTLWWVVWNAPENCANYPDPCEEADFGIADEVQVEVLYAAGNLVGNNGVGHFSAHLSENDDDQSINADIFGLPEFGGLLDAETAEIHMVLRSHGPAISGMVNDQIDSYEGGCTTFLDPFTEIPDAIGECADIYFSIHPPGN